MKQVGPLGEDSKALEGRTGIFWQGSCAFQLNEPLKGEVISPGKEEPLSLRMQHQGGDKSVPASAVSHRWSGWQERQLWDEVT